ncbi:GNAT family N-acetyltransferase [Saccharomonospora sp. NPDC006951]
MTGSADPSGHTSLTGPTGSTRRMGRIDIRPAEPGSVAAQRILRSYFDDIGSRYNGRPVSEAETEAAMLEEPSDDLVPPHGLLLLAFDGDEVLGCAGLRLLGDGIGELTRVYVGGKARGRGLGGYLLREAEHQARLRGVTLLRLDTRSDLVEARGLYAKHGYAEVEPFSEGPYAQHWFAKELGHGEP